MSCPICEKDATPKYKPFCSKRCADVDLSRWLNGTYAVPSMREENDDEAMEAFESALRTAPDDDGKKPQ